MASKASRWNGDESPLSSFHGGTKKAALRAIKDAQRYADWEARGKPPSPSLPSRKDRVRRRALLELNEKGVRVLECDVARPFLPDWATVSPLTAKSGITPRHVRVWDRCGGVCHYCGDQMIRMPNERKSFTLDHVIPRSRGGSDHLSNLVGSCAECNNDKGSLTGEEYEAVLAVRRRQNGLR